MVSDSNESEKVMKSKIIGLFLAGMIFGGAISTFIVARAYSKQFRNFYLASITDHVNIALHLRAQKGDRLLDNLESGFKENVPMIQRQFRGDMHAIDVLWLIKVYYDRQSMDYPMEASAVLKALPAQPSAEVTRRLQALDAELGEENAEDTKVIYPSP